jgi:hypothetical protein
MSYIISNLIIIKAYEIIVGVIRVGRGAGAPGARGAKNERPWAGRGAL